MEGITPTFPIGNNNEFGAGSGIWLFAILALMWGGNGFFGGRGSNAATTEDLAMQSNFTRLEAQGIAQSQEVQRGFTNIGNGLATLGYDLASKFGALEKDMQSCCCEIKQAVLENRYLAEKRFDESKIETLQAKVNELQLNQALCGIVRYPTTATYPVPNPMTFGFNACNGNI